MSLLRLLWVSQSPTPSMKLYNLLVNSLASGRIAGPMEIIVPAIRANCLAEEVFLVKARTIEVFNFFCGYGWCVILCIDEEPPSQRPFCVGNSLDFSSLRVSPAECLSVVTREIICWFALPSWLQISRRQDS